MRAYCAKSLSVPHSSGAKSQSGIHIEHDQWYFYEDFSEDPLGTTRNIHSFLRVTGFDLAEREYKRLQIFCIGLTSLETLCVITEAVS